MDALEWDEEEIITRHRSWPEGTGLDRVLARPRVRVLGMHEVVEQHLGDPMPVLLHAEPVRVGAIEPPTRKLDRTRLREEMAADESVEIDLGELEVVDAQECGDAPGAAHDVGVDGSDDEVIELGSGEIFVEDHQREVWLRESLDTPAPAESLPFHYRSELEAGLDGQAIDACDLVLAAPPEEPAPPLPEARSSIGYEGLFSSFDGFVDERHRVGPAAPVADFDAALSDWPPGPTAAPSYDAAPGYDSAPGFDAAPGYDAAPSYDATPSYDEHSHEVPFDAFDGRVASFEPRSAQSFQPPSSPPSESGISGAFTALPDTWSSAGLPLPDADEPPVVDDWAQRSRTLMPVERSRTKRPLPRRRGRSGNWVVGAALAATLCAGMGLVVGVNALWPKRGALRIDMADPSVAADGVFIDGQRLCDTTPCVVDGLEAGSRNIRILLAGGTQMLTETHAVKSGTETIVLMKPSATPPPAPALAPPHARLILASSGPTMAGANITVTVDGKSRGTLPITLADLVPGEHQLQFSAPGRKTLQKKVTLVDRETQRIDDVTLELETGRLQIALKTPGARVLLAPPRGYRKNLIGPYPKALDVAPGRYEVIAIRPGFRPQVIPVLIDDAHPSAEVTIELNPMPFVPPSQDIYE